MKYSIIEIQQVVTDGDEAGSRGDQWNKDMSMTVIFSLFFLFEIIIYSTPYMNRRATTGGVFKAYVVFLIEKTRPWSVIKAHPSHANNGMHPDHWFPAPLVHLFSYTLTCLDVFLWRLVHRISVFTPLHYNGANSHVLVVETVGSCRKAQSKISTKATVSHFPWWGFAHFLPKVACSAYQWSAFPDSLPSKHTSLSK